MSDTQRTPRSCFARLVIGAICTLGAAPTPAQDYPSKPIRYIVPNTPGVIVDTVARVMAAEMGKNLGQPMVVENKPGGNHAVGFEYVAKQAPADGYTVVSVLVPSMAILPVTAKELRFDPLKDLPPVIGLAEGKYVFGSAASQPWKTLAELAQRFDVHGHFRRRALPQDLFPDRQPGPAAVSRLCPDQRTAAYPRRIRFLALR